MAGRGDTTRYVPLHILYRNYDAQLFSVLPALHALTGCDITSKIGTKKAALVADPIKYLASFGKIATLSERDIQLAEEYLVKVLKGEGVDFMSLRVAVFNFSKR